MVSSSLGEREKWLKKVMDSWGNCGDRMTFPRVSRSPAMVGWLVIYALFDALLDARRISCRSRGTTNGANGNTFSLLFLFWFDGIWSTLIRVCKE